MERHRQQVLNLARELGQGLVVTSGKRGNVTRSREYKARCHQVNTRALDRILEVTDEVAICEPGVTMEKLMGAVPGRMPQVVPEFRKITVGGAISGAALESTSHRFGQFNDTCAWIEVVTGRGEVLRTSPDDHSDLFYALTGSYGSLGLVTAAAVRLVPAQPSVALTYERTDRKGAVEALREGSDPFLEALALAPDDYCVIRGRTDDRPAKRRMPWAPWFYQDLRLPLMTLSDYIFRYDRGAFWMGRYLLHPKIIWAYLTKREPARCLDLIHSLRNRDPGWLSRLLLSPFTSTRALYRGLQAMPEDLRRGAFLIQDSYLPASSAEAFLAHAEETYSIFPMWLCPVRGSERPQLFSPHSGEERFINIGTYGASDPAALPDLEEQVAALGGRKGLYSHSTYQPEQFWQLYDKGVYQTLRAKYGAKGIFPDITEKVLDTQ